VAACKTHEDSVFRRGETDSSAIELLGPKCCNALHKDEGDAMNSRDRVLAALNHVETDRVPIDLSGYRSSGISAIAYPRLRAYLGLEPRPVRVYDIQQQLAIGMKTSSGQFDAPHNRARTSICPRRRGLETGLCPTGSPCQCRPGPLPERVDRGWRDTFPDGPDYCPDADGGFVLRTSAAISIGPRRSLIPDGDEDRGGDGGCM